MNIFVLAIIAASLTVSFGLGVALGTKAGFVAGMYHAIDRTQDHIIAHSKLYNTMLDMGDDGILILKLQRKDGE